MMKDVFNALQADGSQDIVDELHILGLLAKRSEIDNVMVLKTLAKFLTKDEAQETVQFLTEKFQLSPQSESVETPPPDVPKTPDAPETSDIPTSSDVSSTPVVDTQPQPEVVSPPHKKRGRPKGSKNKPKNQDVIAEQSADKTSTEVSQNWFEQAATLSDEDLINRDKIGAETTFPLLYSYALGSKRYRLIKSPFKLANATCLGVFVPYIGAFRASRNSDEFILDVNDSSLAGTTNYEAACIYASRHPKFADNVWSAMTREQMSSIKPVQEALNDLLRKVGGNPVKHNYNVDKFGGCPNYKFRFTCEVKNN